MGSTKGASRGHATHTYGIVLNVTKFRIQFFMGRSAHTIEVLRLRV